MQSIVIGAVLAAGLNFHPGFVDRQAVVESIIDRGLIYELVIKCPVGNAIMSYSKIEKTYCMPRGGCTPKFSEAVSRSCAG